MRQPVMLLNSGRPNFLNKKVNFSKNEECTKAITVIFYVIISFLPNVCKPQNVKKMDKCTRRMSGVFEEENFFA